MSNIVRKKILSLDVGTTVAKVVLFDSDGSELGVIEKHYRVHTPREGFVELSPDDVWQACREALKEIVQEHRCGSEVAGICLSTQGGSLIPADRDGNPVYPMLTWMDSRAAPLVEKWEKEGEASRIRDICGWYPQPGLPFPMICWFSQNRPDIFSRARRWLGVNDFLTGRLTGRFVTNLSLAAEMMLVDIREGAWSREMCRRAGISESALSEIRPSQEPVGPLLPELAGELGISPETVLVNGGQDHSCEALAIGMTDEGKGLLACGTAWVINGAVTTPDMESIPPGMDLNYHVVPGSWIASRFLGGLGGTIEWWVNNFCRGVFGEETFDREEVFETLNRKLPETEPGAGGVIFVPLGGSRNTGQGGTGRFAGLTRSHGFMELTRAVMESAVMEVKWALAELEKSGHRLEELWMIGGATKSSVLPGIMADAAGIPVVMTSYSHGPALGAAILGAAGMGLYDSLEKAREAFGVSRKEVKPRLENREIYEEVFKRYRKEMEKGG